MLIQIQIGIGFSFSLTHSVCRHFKLRRITPICRETNQRNTRTQIRLLSNGSKRIVGASHFGILCQRCVRPFDGVTFPHLNERKLKMSVSKAINQNLSLNEYKSESNIGPKAVAHTLLSFQHNECKREREMKRKQEQQQKC